MLTAATFIIIVSLLLALLKILFAKERADKVIAIDVVSVQLLALTFLLAQYDNNTLPLQFGLVLALLGFLSTVILSHLIRS